MRFDEILMIMALKTKKVAGFLLSGRNSNLLKETND